MGCSGRIEESGVLDGVDLTVMVDRFAGPQAPQDLNGFVEHCETDLRWWPPMAENVFVQRLAGADTEPEAVAEQQ